MCPRRRTKKSISVMAAHGEIHTTNADIHAAAELAKLAECRKPHSTIELTTPPPTAIFHCVAFRSSDSTPNTEEYMTTMFVAMGPCTISNSTGNASAPKAAMTSCAGSAPPPAEAM